MPPKLSSCFGGWLRDRAKTHPSLSRHLVSRSFSASASNSSTWLPLMTTELGSRRSIPRTSRTLWMRSCGMRKRRARSVSEAGEARSSQRTPKPDGRRLRPRMSAHLTAKLQILQSQTLHPLPLDRIDLPPPIAQPKPRRAPPPSRPPHQILLLLLINLYSFLLGRFSPLNRLPFVIEHFEHLERGIGHLVHCYDLHEHGIFASWVQERCLERVRVWGQ